MVLSSQSAKSGAPESSLGSAQIPNSVPHSSAHEAVSMMFANLKEASLFRLLTVFLLIAEPLEAKINPPCLTEESVLVKSFQIFGNGTLLDKERNVQYGPHLYFREGNAFRGCVCRVKTCIKKCCPMDQILNAINAPRRCEQEGSAGQFQKHFLEDELFTAGEHIDAFFLTGYPDCGGLGIFALERRIDNFTLLATGQLADNINFKPVSTFCVDYFSTLDYISAVICAPTESRGLNSTFFSVCLLSASVFMALTLAVYTLLPQLRNLHGKCLMCHVGCLMLAYFLLSAVKFYTGNIQKWICEVVAYLIQFSSAAAFFWLNVICFDICWMFNRVRTVRGSKADREHKKLIIYSIYAWGCSLLLLVICILVSMVANLQSFLPRPIFDENLCWYSSNKEDRLAIILYLYGPVSVSMFANLCFFARTACRIVSLKKGAGVLTRSDSQSGGDKQHTCVSVVKTSQVVCKHLHLRIV
ncbi:Hypothetical predicted protein [Cloeon dipterum]|uniref:G-protein coupled receptors family 2 profile 2 domain-containing protein n=1 Tax=Cloeon dipterum TaxID=197152 RepID=A0A8S1BW28_9INSE|nr:Hypothetical predicted protein [Cloeon dipterum]